MRKFVKILSALLCLCMLLSVAMITVSAEDSAEEYKKADWEADNESHTLTLNGTKTFTLVSIPTNAYFEQMTSFRFVETVEYNDKTYTVRGNSHDPSVVIILNDGRGYLFADQEGEEAIKSYMNHTKTVYFLENADGKRYSRIDENFVEILNDYEESTSWGQRKNADLPTMWEESEVFYITARDSSETIVCQYGAIYKHQNGRYYYCAFDLLSNEYFDSNGYFSHRKGTVMMTRLSEDIGNMVKLSGIDNMQKKDRPIIYESDVIIGRTDVYGNDIEEDDFDDFDDFDDLYDDFENTYLSGLIIAFWMTFSLWGFVFPIGIILLGLLLPASKKRRNKKYWRILAIIGGIWLLTSLSVIAVVLI